MSSGGGSREHSPAAPLPLWRRYLNIAPGYCNAAGICHTFPIAVGEFGTRMTDARDLLMMPQLANYFNNVGNGRDGLHAPITSWFWWCWNANSADTGGMVRRPAAHAPPLRRLVTSALQELEFMRCDHSSFSALLSACVHFRLIARGHLGQIFQTSVSIRHHLDFWPRRLQHAIVVIAFSHARFLGTAIIVSWRGLGT